MFFSKTPPRHPTLFVMAATGRPLLFCILEYFAINLARRNVSRFNVLNLRALTGYKPNDPSAWSFLCRTTMHLITFLPGDFSTRSQVSLRIRLRVDCFQPFCV